jgi:hypothetical protein
LKAQNPPPKKKKRTRVLQEHLKASKSIYTNTPYLGLYLCRPHPIYSVNYSSPSPPINMKNGHFTVGDYLNVTMWVDHYGWPISRGIFMGQNKAPHYLKSVLHPK